MNAENAKASKVITVVLNGMTWKTLKGQVKRKSDGMKFGAINQKKWRALQDSNL